MDKNWAAATCQIPNHFVIARVLKFAPFVLPPFEFFLKIVFGSDLCKNNFLEKLDIGIL